MNPDHPQDRTRRALLKRLGLASAMAYVAPALTPIATARASGSGGGSGGSGPGGREGSGRASRPVVRQPRRQSAPAVRPRPELVALVPSGLSRDAALAAGYVILAERAGVDNADLLRLALPPGRPVQEAAADLARLLPGTVSDVNHLYTPDELLCRDGTCDAHAIVGWNERPSALAPRIGMIDTGINVDHGALAGQKLTVVQATLAERDAAGRQHGTAIAAMLIGRRDSTAPGLLPNAELIAVEAFHRGSGGEVADAFALADALQHLIDARVQVANLSFSGPENAVFGRVVAAALAQGIALVAAAGNGGPGAPPAFPAAWPGVLAVTAVDAGLKPYRRAARGPHVDFAAPGVNLWTAASISGGRLRSGTSYAAPFVTAALAVERLRRPEAPLTGAIAGLAGCALDQGDPGHDSVFGHGVISMSDQCLDEKFMPEETDFHLSGE